MRPVDDKFVIDNEMDSDTSAESNLSLKSRSFLNRVNDRLRKILDRSLSSTRCSLSLLCRSREIHMCRRGEDSRAPTVALGVDFVVWGSSSSW